MKTSDDTKGNEPWGSSLLLEHFPKLYSVAKKASGAFPTDLQSLFGAARRVTECLRAYFPVLLRRYLAICSSFSQSLVFLLMLIKNWRSHRNFFLNHSSSPNFALSIHTTCFNLTSKRWDSLFKVTVARHFSGTVLPWHTEKIKARKGTATDFKFL